MKQLILCYLLMTYSLHLAAQNGVAINTDNSNPSPSAILDVKSTNKGILVPRIALTSSSDITTITNPAISLLIYNTSTTTDLIPGFYYFNGTVWIPIKQTAWNIKGNTGTTSGYNFIGTIDSQALDFRTNNAIKARLTPKGQLEFLNTGSSVFLGEYAGFSDDLSNNRNVFIGQQAGESNTTGERNTAIGSYIFRYNTTGFYNTAIGYNALLYNLTGNYNVANGYDALRANTTGNSNLANGYVSLSFNTTGSNNTAIGNTALYSNTTGNNNTAIGNGAFSSGTTYSNSTALGSATTITASNQVRLGNHVIMSIGGYANWSNVSDLRFKTKIKEGVIGLDFINQLRPVTYHLDMDAIAAFHNIPDSLRSVEAETAKAQILQTGFIAQEVEEAARKLGYNFSGIDIPQNATDHYGLRYAEFAVPLVKAVQELSHKLEAAQQQNEQLKEEIAILKGLKTEVAAIKALLKRTTSK